MPMTSNKTDTDNQSGGNVRRRVKGKYTMEFKTARFDVEFDEKANEEGTFTGFANVTGHYGS